MIIKWWRTLKSLWRNKNAFIWLRGWSIESAWVLSQSGSGIFLVINTRNRRNSKVCTECLRLHPEEILSSRRYKGIPGLEPLLVYIASHLSFKRTIAVYWHALLNYLNIIMSYETWWQFFVCNSDGFYV